jgi:hypothetical protein
MPASLPLAGGKGGAGGGAGAAGSDDAEWSKVRRVNGSGEEGVVPASYIEIDAGADPCDSKSYSATAFPCPPPPWDGIAGGVGAVAAAVTGGVALYDFESQGDDELTITEGERLEFIVDGSDDAECDRGCRHGAPDRGWRESRHARGSSPDRRGRRNISSVRFRVAGRRRTHHHRGRAPRVHRRRFGRCRVEQRPLPPASLPLAGGKGGAGGGAGAAGGAAGGGAAETEGERLEFIVDGSDDAEWSKVRRVNGSGEEGVVHRTAQRRFLARLHHGTA